MSGRSAAPGHAAPAAAFVYLLRCADGTLYCGWTIDLGLRVAAHRDGRASRYTRSRRPVELVWSAAVPDRTAARREEARIKRLPRGAKLALIAAAARRPGGQWPHTQIRTPPGGR